MKTGSLLATILLSLVALAHLLRLLTQSEITLNGTLVPLWVSVLGVVVPGGIALLLLRER
jgi:hypothetical protein